MGYRARWVAVKNADLATVLSTVGLERQSESHEAIYDPGHYAVKMPGDWLVVIGDGWDAMDSVRPEHALALSAGTESLDFYCDDTPMCATVGFYRDGREVWALAYDGSRGRATPVVTGTPPELVGEIIARCQESQRNASDQNVDFLYDAAPEIALALVGFRHDQTLGSGKHLPILVLAPVKPAGSGTWARLKRLLK